MGVRRKARAIGFWAYCTKFITLAFNNKMVLKLVEIDLKYYIKTLML